MGKMKQLEIQFYDKLEASALKETGKPADSADTECGGGDMDLIKMLDEMIAPVPADVVDGNAFGQAEAAQEAAALASDPDLQAEPTPSEEGTAEELAQAIIPPSVAYSHKGMRYTMILQGVCTHCAHCGQPLTDSESVERGIGPVCTRKGYLDDVPVQDDTEALLALAEYPVLVQWLTQKYKPEGNRGLVNGLVRCASLNRRSPVHAACCDAVEALGYKTLASSLRESIAVVEVKKHEEGVLHVWIKKSEWSWNWTNAVRSIPGAYFSRQAKGTLVPEKHKAQLWELIKRFYGGLACKTEKGTVKIPLPA